MNDNMFECLDVDQPATQEHESKVEVVKEEEAKQSVAQEPEPQKVVGDWADVEDGAAVAKQPVAQEPESQAEEDWVKPMRKPMRKLRRKPRVVEEVEEHRESGNQSGFRLQLPNLKIPENKQELEEYREKLVQFVFPDGKPVKIHYSNDREVQVGVKRFLDLLGVKRSKEEVLEEVKRTGFFRGIPVEASEYTDTELYFRVAVSVLATWSPAGWFSYDPAKNAPFLVEEGARWFPHLKRENLSQTIHETIFMVRKRLGWVKQSWFDKKGEEVVPLAFATVPFLHWCFTLIFLNNKENLMKDTFLWMTSRAFGFEIYPNNRGLKISAIESGKWAVISLQTDSGVKQVEEVEEKKVFKPLAIAPQPAKPAWQNRQSGGFRPREARSQTALPGRLVEEDKKVEKVEEVEEVEEDAKFAQVKKEIAQVAKELALVNQEIQLGELKKQLAEAKKQLKDQEEQKV